MPSQILTTDVSNHILGAVLEGRSCSGTWTQEESRLHISILETFANLQSTSDFPGEPPARSSSSDRQDFPAEPPARSSSSDRQHDHPALSESEVRDQTPLPQSISLGLSGAWTDLLCFGPFTSQIQTMLKPTNGPALCQIIRTAWTSQRSGLSTRE